MDANNSQFKDNGVEEGKSQQIPQSQNEEVMEQSQQQQRRELVILTSKTPEYKARLEAILKHASPKTILNDEHKGRARAKELFLVFEWDRVYYDGDSPPAPDADATVLRKALFQVGTMLFPDASRTRGYLLENQGLLLRWEWSEEGKKKKTKQLGEDFGKYRRACEMHYDRVIEIAEERGLPTSILIANRHAYKLIALFAQNQGRKKKRGIDDDLPLEADDEWTLLDKLHESIEKSTIRSDGSFRTPTREELSSLRSQTSARYNSEVISSVISLKRSGDLKRAAKDELSDYLIARIRGARNSCKRYYTRNIYLAVQDVNKIGRLNLEKVTEEFLYGDNDDDDELKRRGGILLPPNIDEISAYLKRDKGLIDFVIKNVTSTFLEVPIAASFSSTDPRLEDCLNSLWANYQNQDRSTIVILSGPNGTAQGKTSLITTWRAVFPSIDLPTNPGFFWSSTYDTRIITTVIADEACAETIPTDKLKQIASGMHDVNKKNDGLIEIAGKKPMILMTRNDLTPFRIKTTSKEAIADRIDEIRIEHRFNVCWIVVLGQRDAVERWEEEGGWRRRRQRGCNIPYTNPNPIPGRIAICIAAVDKEDSDDIPLISYSDTIEDITPYIDVIGSGNTKFDTQNLPSEVDPEIFGTFADRRAYMNARADRYKNEGRAAVKRMLSSQPESNLGNPKSMRIEGLQPSFRLSITPSPNPPSSVQGVQPSFPIIINPLKVKTTPKPSLHLLSMLAKRRRRRLHSVNRLKVKGDGFEGNLLNSHLK